MPDSSPVDLLLFILVGAGAIVILATFFIAIVITNQRKVIAAQREKLAESKRVQEILQRIPQQIIRAQEEERSRIARELHDGINQMLASIMYRLHTLRVPRRSENHEAESGDAMNAIARDLEKTIEEVKRISHHLHPKVFDNLGFEAAVRALCDEFGKRTHMTIEYSFGDLLAALSSDTGLVVYRIIQEALRNIETHAHAQHVSIEAARIDSKLRIVIQDNGRGFDNEATASNTEHQRGLGLTTMKERAAAIGGSLEIQSAPTHGTRVVLQIPREPRV